MRTLTQREKKTLRYATVGIALYLALFGGFKVWKFFDRKRTEYLNLVADARQLKLDVQRREAKLPHIQKLMEEFHLDPAKLTRATVVAEASAAIQKAAQSGGVQLGPIRESPARSANRELASIQLEGTGPVPAALGLLQRLNTCGYPLIIDSVQFSSDPMRPGPIKFNLTVIILDFEQWKSVEVPHA